VATHIGIGFSQNPDTSRAAREAAKQAKIQTGQSTINLTLVFNTVHYNAPEILSSIREILEDTQIVGCSSAGVILCEGIHMRGIAVLAIHSDDIQFGIGSVEEKILSADIRQGGSMLAKNALTDFGQGRRQAFICFTDGLLKNNAAIIKGLQEIFGAIFPVLGAGSSDDFHFQKTYQYYQEEVLTQGATGFVIGGQLTLGIGSRHGWKPVGKPRFITQSDDHIIKTIDDKKACSIYEEYFGESAQDLHSQKFGQMTILYPLGIYIEEEDEYLLRNAVDIHPDGSILCQGEVPQGAEIHIMLGNKDSCRQAAVDAAVEAHNALSGKVPRLILIFESLTRHKLLGRGGFKEIQLIQEILGSKTPLFGMYSYGEISPFHSLSHIKKTHLQNASILILAIG